MNNVFILGTGTMGRGISQVFAQSGIKVTVFSRNIEKCIHLKESIKKVLLEKVKKTELEVLEILSNIEITSDLKAAKNSDLVIEALVENIEIKKEYFQKLNSIVSSSTILCTNTSALSVTEIASVATNSENVIGLHFFNPAPVMNLVEVIKGIGTSDETTFKIVELVKRLNKEVVVVDETPGFIVNRILVPMINEGIMVLEAGIAKKEDIDKAMKLGAGHPLGPLELSDLIGNDVVLKIMETLFKETGDSKYRPSYLLKKYVLAGKLGRKTSEGFYKY
ncbi:3-hydroxyacyl-CoA dehydrogenase family protein [Cetobacterium sp.]|uniref:3-hydroxyacyl-CoA dehydrogenase family protein n=1 Tax=Cetobacterium sp. TaxID=2071632 RepID=UPI003F32A3EB